MPQSTTVVISEVGRITDQLQRAFYGEAWHGPAVHELIAEMKVDVAAAKPLHGIHSIWEIVLHTTKWLEVVRARLHAPTPDLAPEEDWRHVEHVSEDAWEMAKQRLDGAYEALLHELSDLPEWRLNETVPGRDYNNYVMLHGAVQHCIYHAGQIALLKKAA